MSENLQLFRGLALSRLVWWTKDSLLLEFFLPHAFALFHRRGNNNLPKRPKFPLDSFLSLLCSRKMISPRGLERRESGQNLSDLITEQSDDFSVTQDYLVASFAPPTSFGGGRKVTNYRIYIVS